MRKSSKSGGTPATTTLSQRGVAFTEHSYEHDPAAQSFGLEAAEALGVPAARVFKTLLVSIADTGRLGVMVVPVDRQLDLKAAASALSVKKVAMADPSAAERSTGYVVGGISPIGQRTSLPTVIDESALQHETVYVSGGRRGFDIELSPVALIAVLDAATAPIAR